jgi:hypothetical protein
MQHKWKERVDFVWKTTNGETIIGDQLLTKFFIELNG